LPEHVRNVLEELGFDQDQIIKWNEPIDVPFGASTELFVAREAILSGLEFSHYDIYPGLSIYNTGNDCIPDCVTEDAKSLSPEEIMGGQVNSRFLNKNIFVYKMGKIHKNNKDVYQKVVKPMEYKYRKKDFLYKGLPRWSF
jgi:hypothetical protein